MQTTLVKNNLTNALFLSTNGIYTATKVNDFILRIIVLSDRALGYGGIWQSLLSHLCYSTSANYRTELMSKPVIVVALYTIFDLTLIQLAGIGFSGSIPSRRILPHPRKLSCIDGSKKDNIMNIDVASRHVISVHDLPLHIIPATRIPRKGWFRGIFVQRPKIVCDFWISVKARDFFRETSRRLS